MEPDRSNNRSKHQFNDCTITRRLFVDVWRQQSTQIIVSTRMLGTEPMVWSDGTD